jgi:TPP-dependent pyruvate/acetoin dehydrogenase alpha subunit
MVSYGGSTTPSSGHGTATDDLELLRSMWLIRAFEEKVSELYARGMIGGLVHLAIGQEGVAVGACAELRQHDFVFGGHRSHGHAIAKGADVGLLMAELAGKLEGYCAGKGGSMHIAVPDVGFITATGVVGGNIPLALGGALSIKSQHRPGVSMAFFGDGAGQTGSFHESLNIAGLWSLPIVFVCENNGFAEFTPLSAHTSVERLATHAGTYGIPHVTVDGNDVRAVREAVAPAVALARGGGGPSFVECLTYRMRGHYEGDPAKYRELSERREWKAKDPILRFTRQLLESATDAVSRQVAEIEPAARDTVARAADFAVSGLWPDAGQVTSHVCARSG